MKRIAIHSVPRSASSWLGQILNSSPLLLYRYQPLFSYEFKDYLNENSTLEEIEKFFKAISESENPFLLQTEQVKQGKYPDFKKNKKLCKFAAYKEVRYHHILKNLLNKDPEIKVIGLIRNPLAVINSWLKAPKEFRPEQGWKELEEWRYAPKKNQGKPEEFNGYEKWKEVARLFREFNQNYPNQFYLIKYHSLIADTLKEVEKIFDFCQIPLEQPTIDFIQASCQNYQTDPYSVFRYRPIDDSWKKELNSIIVQAILDDLKDTELETYIGRSSN